MPSNQGYRDFYEPVVLLVTPDTCPDWTSTFHTTYPNVLHHILGYFIRVWLVRHCQSKQVGTFLKALVLWAVCGVHSEYNQSGCMIESSLTFRHSHLVKTGAFSGLIFSAVKTLLIYISELQQAKLSKVIPEDWSSAVFHAELCWGMVGGSPGWGAVGSC